MKIETLDPIPHKSGKPEPREGAMMRYNDEGKADWCNPGTQWFSTMTMFATHFWKNGEWVPINPDSAKEAQDSPDV